MSTTTIDTTRPAGGIYETIGGSAAVRSAVTMFYERLLRDPALAPYFAGVDLRRLATHQRAFLAAALGGPQLYAGRNLAAAHAHLDVTDEDFDGVVGHLAATLLDLGVAPDAVETIGAQVEALRPQIVTAAMAEAG